MPKSVRVDARLVALGLAENLDQAQRLVMAGRVLFKSQLISQPSQSVPVESDLELLEEQRFVSRGGEKLQAAIDEFRLDVTGRICADAGASTGGFTDCLLQAGAEKVYAIDVGYGILDWKLRNDPRVITLERTNVRKLEQLPEPITFLTADVSFISLKMILPRTINWFSDQGVEGVVLIKPQFEATKDEAAKGEGVITDPAVHRRVLEEVLSFSEELNFIVKGLIRSPLTGPAGNQEFLVWLGYPNTQVSDLDILIDRIFQQDNGA